TLRPALPWFSMALVRAAKPGRLPSRAPPALKVRRSSTIGIWSVCRNNTLLPAWVCQVAISNAGAWVLCLFTWLSVVGNTGVAFSKEGACELLSKYAKAPITEATHSKIKNNRGRRRANIIRSLLVGWRAQYGRWHCVRAPTNGVRQR